jgi:hypothetical protein
MSQQHDLFIAALRTGEIPPLTTQEAAKQMRKALNARAAKGTRYSVTAAQGRYIIIGSVGGWMDDAKRKQLAALLGYKEVSSQGISVRPSQDALYEFVDRCAGKTPRVVYEMSHEEMMSS